MALENVSPYNLFTVYDRPRTVIPERYYTQTEDDSDIDELIEMMARLSLEDRQPEPQRGVKRKCTWDIVQGDEKRQRTDQREIISDVCKKRKFEKSELDVPSAKRMRCA